MYPSVVILPSTFKLGLAPLILTPPYPGFSTKAPFGLCKYVCPKILPTILNVDATSWIETLPVIATFCCNGVM